MKKILGVAIVAGLFASACSGSLNEDEQAVADKITEEFTAQFNVSEDSAIEQKDADCVGEQYVKEIGFERLEELNITAEDASAVSGSANFTEEEGTTENNILKDCVGIEKLLITSLEFNGVENADAECVVGKLDKDLFEKDLFEEEDVDQNELQENTEKAAEDCEVDLPNLF